MNLNDSKLFCDLKNGSSDAFEQLYVAYKTPALKFCFSLLKDMDEAECMVQDVFMQLWIKRAKLNTQANFQSYLFSCLRNRAYDHFKKIRRSELAIDNLSRKIETLQQVEEVDETIKIESLQKAVEELPTSRKAIVKLRYEGGKSYKEIADHLNISSNTVKNQLIKAKHYLRSHVDISLVICMLIPLKSFFE
ncbi:MAG: RNA polymerase sigma-70 factor [Thalassobius sp.]|nr:RNA polymerase sigma-70 factor [Thalassovita sp.]